MTEADLQITAEDEIEWAKDDHATNPAPFAKCPDCQLFSAYPWQKVFGTQNGTIYAWGGVCKTHGAWRDGS